MVTFPYNSRLITKVETATDRSSIQEREGETSQFMKFLTRTYEEP